MSTALVPSEIIENKIFIIRGHKVMLSVHLAKLYEVQARALIQAVKRNNERFPKDFMFQLNHQEYENLKSQFVTSSWGGARRAKPYAFTQEGIAMLSSVLNSKRAIQVNIAIMRAFVKLRELMISHKDLARKIEDLEHKFNRHDENFIIVFKAIKKLLEAPREPKKKKLPIGFRH
ncbi:MAG: ORF6N domain-containing protein [Candidatus Omnitrophica bacterium]|nr:ORF6N domain-containing protein [Candidatus Omnitrophota bacterium]